MKQPHDDSSPRVLLHMPVDVRSASLALLAVMGAVFMLKWASAVFIPILLGLLFSYALSPIVNRLHRWHVPRPLGAAMVVVAVVGSMGWTVYSMSDDATSLVESLPDAAQKFRQSLKARSGNSESSPIDKVQAAANQLEQAANESGSSQPLAARGVTRVQIEKPRFNIKDYLWTGTLGLATALGQSVLVSLITYFLLASGNTFRRKMVRIAGPTMRQKKVTLEALNEITVQIQRYLWVQVAVSVLVGLFTWAAYLMIGLQHAGVWGLAAGVLNMIPYIGSAAVTAGSALVALTQFASLDSALIVAVTSVGIHVVTGYLITPWMTSRASRMNPVVVFVGVLAWGWLWGAWGLLLGMPILMVVKAICDRVDDLKPIGELLGS